MVLITKKPRDHSQGFYGVVLRYKAAPLCSEVALQQSFLPSRLKTKIRITESEATENYSIVAFLCTANFLITHVTP